MRKPAIKNDTLIKISDMVEFRQSIKERILNFYIFTFNNYKEFMDVYDERYLTTKLVDFWVNQYSFINNGERLIYLSDYEALVGRIYKEYCQLMMNKLVDTGYLQLMWDKKKKIVFWKKTKI